MQQGGRDFTGQGSRLLIPPEAAGNAAPRWLGGAQGMLGCINRHSVVFSPPSLDVFAFPRNMVDRAYKSQELLWSMAVLTSLLISPPIVMACNSPAYVHRK